VRGSSAGSRVTARKCDNENMLKRFCGRSANHFTARLREPGAAASNELRRILRTPPEKFHPPLPKE